MPKTKSGELISWKEYGRRWKVGMQNLTPIQRVSNDIGSSWVILIGFIASIIALLFFNKTFGVITWGLILIFLGNAYSNIVKLFSLYGQKNLYQDLEGQMEEIKIPYLFEDKEVNGR